MKPNLSKFLPICFYTSILFLFFQNNLLSTSESEPKEINYVIDVTVNPAESSLRGASKVTLMNVTEMEISFQLLSSLKINEFKSNDFDYKIGKKDEYYNTLTITKKKNNTKKSLVFSIIYEGKVFDPPAETNMTQKHSNSRGIISSKNNEGIYLPAGSFYPSTNNALGSFECVVTGPSDYIFITSGNLTTLTKRNNDIIRKWKMPFAADEITLVGGKFIQYHKEFDGKNFNLFTYDSTKSADTYLDAVIEHYKIYTELFGDYPFNMFSIVENFFATGFGMPGYTLLSGKLLAMPWVTLSPGSLAHEFVHNWWGNSVYVDYSGGNWCEALTTFSTNYYFNVVKKKKESEIDWRKKALMSLDALEPSKNYPVADFKYQEDMFDAVIGYQKGAFIFNEILKLIGKDAFFGALKNFAINYRGKRAYWNDLIDEFTRASSSELVKKYDISEIIEKWLKSTELPELKLISAQNEKDEIVVQLSKTTDLPITIPIKFSKGDKIDIHRITLTENKSTLRFKNSIEADRIEVDSEYESLRKLYSWEKPFSFGRTLSSNPLVVLPNDTSRNYAVAKEFYNELVRSDYKFKSINIGDLNQNIISENSLILLGGVEDYPLIKKYTENLPKGIEFDGISCKYSDKSIAGSEVFLMLNSDHPVKSDLFTSVIVFDNLKDITPLKRLMHYQSYSLVLLSVTKPGRPLFDMELFPKTSTKFELQRSL